MDQNNVITAIYGDGSSPSLQDMTIELLETVEMAARIPSGSRICLKPNLVKASDASEGATTHPEILEGALSYLHAHGHRDITILEGSWAGGNTARAFKQCGYEKLAKQYGLGLIDTQKSSSHSVDAGGHELKICDEMDNFDVLINFPVLKGHCQARYTGALKNLKGCIPNAEKRRYHSLGLHEPIARLNTVIKQDFIIMDGICGDPTFEEGGSPSQTHRILYAEDPVLLDSYAVTVFELEPADVPYILRSEELSVGTAWNSSSQLREINEPVNVQQQVAQDPLLDQLGKMVDQRDACSTCYASLIHALKEAGTQPTEEVSFAIGRAFRDSEAASEAQKQQLLGIGSCTRHFTRFVPGCPPTPEAIRSYFETE
ncbi:MAG: DUF362 domain-containing protein [Spirochaetota bacterium]